MGKLSNRAKKIKKTRPLEPFVSKEQILAFDPMRQETFTESRAVNEVLLAIEVEGLRSAGEIAAYLAVDGELLRPTMQLVTGMKVNDIVRTRMVGKIMELRAANPSIKADEAARAVGYRDHATLFKILGQEEYDRLFAKFVKKEMINNC